MINWHYGLNLGLIWLVITLLIAPAPAQAYLDPGTSCFLFQCQLGTLLGVAVSLKLFWKRIRARFSQTTEDPEEKAKDD